MYNFSCFVTWFGVSYETIRAFLRLGIIFYFLVVLLNDYYRRFERHEDIQMCSNLQLLRLSTVISSFHSPMLPSQTRPIVPGREP